MAARAFVSPMASAGTAGLSKIDMDTALAPWSAPMAFSAAEPPALSTVQYAPDIVVAVVTEAHITARAQRPGGLPRWSDVAAAFSEDHRGCADGLIYAAAVCGLLEVYGRKETDEERDEKQKEKQAKEKDSQEAADEATKADEDAAAPAAATDNAQEAPQPAEDSMFVFTEVVLQLALTKVNVARLSGHPLFDAAAAGTGIISVPAIDAASLLTDVAFAVHAAVAASDAGAVPTALPTAFDAERYTAGVTAPWQSMAHSVYAAALAKLRAEFAVVDAPPVVDEDTTAVEAKEEAFSAADVDDLFAAVDAMAPPAQVAPGKRPRSPGAEPADRKASRDPMCDGNCDDKNKNTAAATTIVAPAAVPWDVFCYAVAKACPLLAVPAVRGLALFAVCLQTTASIGSASFASLDSPVLASINVALAPTTAATTLRPTLASTDPQWAEGRGAEFAAKKAVLLSELVEPADPTLTQEEVIYAGCLAASVIAADKDVVTVSVAATIAAQSKARTVAPMATAALLLATGTATLTEARLLKAVEALALTGIYTVDSDTITAECVLTLSDVTAAPRLYDMDLATQQLGAVLALATAPSTIASIFALWRQVLTAETTALLHPELMAVVWWSFVASGRVVGTPQGGFTVTGKAQPTPALWSLRGALSSLAASAAKVLGDGQLAIPRDRVGEVITQWCDAFKSFQAAGLTPRHVLQALAAHGAVLTVAGSLEVSQAADSLFSFVSVPCRAVSPDSATAAFYAAGAEFTGSAAVAFVTCLSRPFSAAKVDTTDAAVTLCDCVESLLADPRSRLIRWPGWMAGSRSAGVSLSFVHEAPLVSGLSAPDAAHCLALPEVWEVREAPHDDDDAPHEAPSPAKEAKELAKQGSGPTPESTPTNNTNEASTAPAKSSASKETAPSKEASKGPVKEAASGTTKPADKPSEKPSEKPSDKPSDKSSAAAAKPSAPKTDSRFSRTETRSDSGAASRTRPEEERRRSPGPDPTSGRFPFYFDVQQSALTNPGMRKVRGLFEMGGAQMPRMIRQVLLENMKGEGALKGLVIARLIARFMQEFPEQLSNPSEALKTKLRDLMRSAMDLTVTLGLVVETRDEKNLQIYRLGPSRQLLLFTVYESGIRMMLQQPDGSFRPVARNKRDDDDDDEDDVPLHEEDHSKEFRCGHTATLLAALPADLHDEIKRIALPLNVLGAAALVRLAGDFYSLPSMPGEPFARGLDQFRKRVRLLPGFGAPRASAQLLCDLAAALLFIPGCDASLKHLIRVSGRTLPLLRAVERCVVASQKSSTELKAAIEQLRTAAAKPHDVSVVMPSVSKKHVLLPGMPGRLAMKHATAKATFPGNCVLPPKAGLPVCSSDRCSDVQCTKAHPRFVFPGGAVPVPSNCLVPTDGKQKALAGTHRLWLCPHLATSCSLGPRCPFGHPVTTLSRLEILTGRFPAASAPPASPTASAPSKTSTAASKPTAATPAPKSTTAPATSAASPTNKDLRPLEKPSSALVEAAKKTTERWQTFWGAHNKMSVWALAAAMRRDGRTKASQAQSAEETQVLSEGLVVVPPLPPTAQAKGRLRITGSAALGPGDLEQMVAYLSHQATLCSVVFYSPSTMLVQLRDDAEAAALAKQLPEAMHTTFVPSTPMEPATLCLRGSLIADLVAAGVSVQDIIGDVFSVFGPCVVERSAPHGNDIPRKDGSHEHCVTVKFVDPTHAAADCLACLRSLQFPLAAEWSCIMSIGQQRS